MAGLDVLCIFIGCELLAFLHHLYSFSVVPFSLICQSCQGEYELALIALYAFLRRVIETFDFLCLRMM
jgi:hypothetical protein